MIQASKSDFNFGGQLAINSKNMVAKLKFQWPKLKKIGNQK
jgi:hypothetical protein